MAFLCERRKCYVSDQLMNEALLSCVQENHCQCVEDFIKTGADVNFANYEEIQHYWWQLRIVVASVNLPYQK